MFRLKRMLIFNPQLNLPKYKTRVSAKFYAILRLFTKFKSLILQLYYLPILDLQNSNHPGGSISFFAQRIADFKLQLRKSKRATRVSAICVIQRLSTKNKSLNCNSITS